MRAPAAQTLDGNHTIANLIAVGRRGREVARKLSLGGRTPMRKAAA